MTLRVAALVVVLASCGAQPAAHEPLPTTLAGARPLKPGELTALGLPDTLARSLPRGATTPVASVVLRWTEGDATHEDVRGLQFAVAPEAADLTVRGLQRLLGRNLNTGLVFHAPAENGGRRIFVLSREATVADAFAEVGQVGIDANDLAGTLAAWKDETGLRLLAVTPDEVRLDLPQLPGDESALAGALADLMPTPEVDYPQILQQFASRQVRLTIPR